MQLAPRTNASQRGRRRLQFPAMRLAVFAFLSFSAGSFGVELPDFAAGRETGVPWEG